MVALRTPPRPRLVLRVGVTGHRLNRLLEGDVDLPGVEGEVRAVLAEIKRAVTHCATQYALAYEPEPELILISPLAEGADQIVATAAVEMGYRLHVPLPCVARRYVAGFQGPTVPIAEDPCTAFERLMRHAESVQVLDGRPDATLDGAAYAAVGRAVLRHADILIAVWDRSPAEGAGGTGAVVSQARAWDLPVVLLDPRAPGRWRLDADGLDAPAARSETRDLAGAIGRILAPPSPSPEDESDDRRRPRGMVAQAVGQQNVAPALVQYLHTKPTGKIGGLFNALVALWAFEWPFRAAPVRLGQRSIERARLAWDRTWAVPTPITPRIAEPVSRLLREYFAWADGLAERFGTAHRDVSTAAYVFAPLSVVVAVSAQMAWGDGHTAALIQAAVVCVILFVNVLLYWQAVDAGYHARWIDYRSLAEELRYLAFLWPLGRPLRFVGSAGLSGEAATEANHFAWIAWYGRAVARQGGLFPAVFTPDMLDDCRDMLIDRFLRPQCHYHGRTQRRFRVVQARLHRTALALFAAAFALALIDFIWAVRGRALPSRTDLTGIFGFGLCAAALAATLPYVATALHGFQSQGDFWNLARRSERMCKQLEPLMETAARTPPAVETLGDLAEDAADVMRDEVLNWRVFVRLKPPSLA